ncbi:MAG: DNA-formamidopyrimidine glycosylase family protein [Gemmatimonadota bacterium]
MPELPEVETYLGAFRTRIVGEVLGGIRIRSPSLLRTFDPPVAAARGRRVVSVARLGKRIVWTLDGELHLVFHLMVTGRFHRRKPGAALPRKHVHAAFDFPRETFFLTERGTRKKASLHLVRGRDGLAELDPGGLEPLQIGLDTFSRRIRQENRTLKRALTDPRIFSGIGNAHSDEILWEARLSPVQRSQNLSDPEVGRLFEAVQENLARWTRRLAEETGDAFPEKITAFHPEMGVHGRYGKPCPASGDPVQRIVYAQRETNYCPTCQTGGKLLADRAISRLLGEDWPRTLEELEEHRGERSGTSPSD